MTEDRGDGARIRIRGDARAFEVTRASGASRTLEQLTMHRRTAQAEANRAYEEWSQTPSNESYTAYRAAQDRADAAQDQLAAAHRLERDPNAVAP